MLDSWQLEHTILQHPEHLQVTCQKNVTVHNSPRCIEPSQHGEFNTYTDSVEYLYVFRYLEHLEYLAAA
jgi:hypothetical protein